MTATARREAIVESARPLFALRGFDAVTTRDVAEAAGVSEALIYRHFDTKAALYEAVQDACVRLIVDDIQRIVPMPDDTRTLVLAVYLMMRSIHASDKTQRRDLPRLLLRSLLEDGKFARGFLSRVTTLGLDKIDRCIRAGISAGEIRDSADGAVASFWFCHHLATAVLFYRLPGNTVAYGLASDDAVFDHSVAFALRGLGLTESAIERHYQPDAFGALAGHSL